MKKRDEGVQPEAGGSGEVGGSFQRGPRPAPGKAPVRDYERDRYGSPGKQHDAAGRKGRESPGEEEPDKYGEFLRNGESEETDPSDSKRSS